MVNSRIVPACRKLICRLLPTGYLTIEQVSNKLGIPIRTLQRRLDAAGYTYSQLVEAVRLEHACRLLTKSDARMVDIAALLGFRDPSNFNRAFQRWTGLTPKQYRCRLAGLWSKERKKGSPIGTK